MPPNLKVETIYSPNACIIKTYTFVSKTCTGGLVAIFNKQFHSWVEH